ncbi:MAG: right-handed parallel beta-helix repeat-containing protein [Anaerolineae bacterium]|nr:right-handed parallel beta-helix repeat-containing protein [Anaerolineae bacterium]
MSTKGRVYSKFYLIASGCMALLGMLMFSYVASAQPEQALMTPEANEYHVDADNGSDMAGCGTAGSPCRTLAYVRSWLVGGDTVILHDGNYGAIQEGLGATDVFTDWVTYRAAPGTAPQINSVSIGANVGSYFGLNYAGTYDAYLRLEGLYILDGVATFGARHVEINGCTIHRVGPWTGSEANIEKIAVYIRAGTAVTVTDTDITQTAIGIAAAGHQVSLIGNHIHDITHDGIRSIGLVDSLIADNHIHNLDDGEDDASGYDWNRHCDAIHIFIAGAEQAENLIPNHNVTIRGNLIYDTESQGVQFNNYYRHPSVVNTHIIFENNIFGPTRSNPFNQPDFVDTLIFRNNTYLYFPEGHVFTSAFRTITCTNHTFRIGQGTDIQVYNNILVNVDGEEYAEVFDWNLIRNPSSNAAYGRFTVVGQDPLFVDAFAFDGHLLAGSPAVNAGTRRFAPTPIYDYDREGTPRDTRPDLGAYELPGQTPIAEGPRQSFPGPKIVFVDDFEDANFEIDPWLETETQQGLSWYQPSTDLHKYIHTYSSDVLERNSLSGPLSAGSSWLFSEQGADWKEYTLSFDAHNAYQVTGAGPLLLAQDAQNAYWLNIARDSGRLVRLMLDGAQPTTTTLATEPAIAMPHEGEQSYRVGILCGADGITFTVDVGGDGSAELVYVERDPDALARFTSGGIGFHRDSADDYHRIMYDNIRVELLNVPALLLSATPRDRAIRLAWTLNITSPFTGTWQIDHNSDTGTAYLPVTGLISSTRAYTLSDLVNGHLYTVTLSTLGLTPPLSDTVTVRLPGSFVYLPLVLRGN